MQVVVLRECNAAHLQITSEVSCSAGSFLAAQLPPDPPHQSPDTHLSLHVSLVPGQAVS